MVSIQYILVYRPLVYRPPRLSAHRVKDKQSLVSSKHKKFSKHNNNLFSKQVLVNIRTILDWFKVHTRIVVTTHKAQDFMSAKKEEPPGDPRLSAHFVIAHFLEKLCPAMGR